MGAPASTWKIVAARHGGVVAARFGLWHRRWSTSSAAVVEGEVLGFGFLAAGERGEVLGFVVVGVDFMGFGCW